MRTGRMFHRDAQTFLVHLFGQEPRGQPLRGREIPLPSRRPDRTRPTGAARDDGQTQATADDREPGRRQEDAARARRDHCVHGPHPEGLRHANMGVGARPGYLPPAPRAERGCRSCRRSILPGNVPAAASSNFVPSAPSGGFAQDVASVLPSPASSCATAATKSAAPPSGPAARRHVQRASNMAAAIRSAAAAPTAPATGRRRRAWKEAGLCTSCGRRRPEDNRSVLRAVPRGPDVPSTAGAMARGALPATACAAINPRSGACRAAAGVSRWRRSASLPRKRAPLGRDAMSRGARRARVWIVESPPVARPVVSAAHIGPTPARPSVTWRRFGRRRSP